MPESSDGRDVHVVLYCPTCDVHWYRSDEPAKCTDPQHLHHAFDIHRHRSLVVLPDGTAVIAVSFDPADPYSRDQAPDYGLYLDHQWQPPWPHVVLEWPDFDVPDDPAELITRLRGVLDRSRGGERVEVGCIGGHGRTGTALACLAVLAGQSPSSAVAWVRGHYCPRAVETPEQVAFVEGLST